MSTSALRTIQGNDDAGLLVQASDLIFSSTEYVLWSLKQGSCFVDSAYVINNSLRPFIYPHLSRTAKYAEPSFGQMKGKHTIEIRQAAIFRGC